MKYLEEPLRRSVHISLSFSLFLSLSLFYFSFLSVRCVDVCAQASPVYNPLPWRPCFNFKQRVGNSRIAALKSLNRKMFLSFSPFLVLSLSLSLSLCLSSLLILAASPFLFVSLIAVFFPRRCRCSREPDLENSQFRCRRERERERILVRQRVD